MEMQFIGDLPRLLCLNLRRLSPCIHAVRSYHNFRRRYLVPLILGMLDNLFHLGHDLGFEFRRNRPAILDGATNKGHVVFARMQFAIA